MKACAKERLLRLRSHGRMLLFTLCCLMAAWNAEATAPRVAQPLFGNDSQADVVGYQAAQTDSKARAEGQLIQALVTEAFQAGGMLPVIDLLPSKQLAHYEFVVNEAPALIIDQEDITAQHMERSYQVVFYLKGAGDGVESVSLMFSKKNPRAREMHDVFDKGLRAIVENGRYLDVVQQHLGAGKLPAGMSDRLKRLNPGWK